MCSSDLEMRQSNNIIKQCAEWLRNHPGPVMSDNHKVAPPSRVDMKSNMEELIRIGAYRAGADAMRDLLGGTVQAWFAPIPSVLEQARSGQVVAVASTGPARSAWLPDLPTVSEAAFQGYDVRLWLGLYAPASVPADRITLVEQTVSRILATPEMRRTLEIQGVSPLPMSRADFDRFMIAEVARWKAVVDKLGLSAQ